jgi:hypothetical protein
MRVKFLTNSPLGDVNSDQTGEVFACSINMSYFYIKHYYDLHGKDSNVQWLPGELIVFDPVNTIVKNVLDEHPTILALSVFLWNESLQFEIAKQVKEKSPNTVIVVGGPQLTAHKNSSFFEQHPYIDYAVYGDGEKAFQQIIDYVGGHITTDTFVNIATRDKIYPYEQLTDPQYFSTSPYLSQQSFIQHHVEYLESKGIPRSHMMMAIEFARGCMYNCSFCDWSQNLTKKVKRRQTNWKDELLFFKNLDINIRETDANFGQYTEDIEIYDYAIQLYDPKKNFKFIAWNTPKLKKEPAYYILKNNAEVYGTNMIITLQDINEDVLTKMDRPSLSWEDHKIMIKKLKETCTVDTKNMLYAQLMLGVPGQSYDSVCDTMYKIWTEAGIYRYTLSHWLLLPNSPGADPLYQKLHQLKWIPSYTVNAGKTVDNYTSLDLIYKDLKSSNKDLRVHMYESTAVYSTPTMTFVDMIAAQILKIQLHRLREKFNPEEIKSFNIIFNRLKQASYTEACKQFDTMQPLIDKHGFVILGSFDPKKSTLMHYFDLV